MITIALIGDVMLGRGVARAAERMLPYEHWGDTAPVLHAADLRICNLECAITGHQRPWTRSPKVYHFRADRRAIDILKSARIDACMLANNHILDYEEQGLLDTLHALEAAGIRHAGAGRNASDAALPALLAAGDPPVRVAVVAFTDNESIFGAGKTPGTNYLEVSLGPAALARIEAAIAAARQAADLVIFSNHWGTNYRERPSPLFRDFARAVIERGADAYYGHSAHVFHGIELHRGKPILYDTGDFIDDYALHPSARNDWSFVFLLRFAGAQFAGLEMVPVQLRFAKAELARDPQRAAIMQRMRALSAELGTALVRGGDRLTLAAPSAQ
jgi:poly-gamma-glutamate synthesis protein (capsule biosynthesis protein)